MILVDTSVLLNYLKKSDNIEAIDKKKILKEVIVRELPYGIAPFTYLEILQGARDNREFVQLQTRLDLVHMYHLPRSSEPFIKAAHIYVDLKKQGITLRGGPIDILIALTAMHHDLPLLHDDRDFDKISSIVPKLKVIKSISDIDKFFPMGSTIGHGDVKSETKEKSKMLPFAWLDRLIPPGGR